jgi:hypothetical protein
MRISRIAVCVALFLLGIGIGYSLAMRKVFLTREEYIRLLHNDLEHQARAYFRFVQAQDSQHPADISELRQRAWTNLTFYVREVQLLRDQGFTWAPWDGQFYTNAQAYLIEHRLSQ